MSAHKRVRIRHCTDTRNARFLSEHFQLCVSLRAKRREKSKRSFIPPIIRLKRFYAKEQQKRELSQHCQKTRARKRRTLPRLKRFPEPKSELSKEFSKKKTFGVVLKQENRKKSGRKFAALTKERACERNDLVLALGAGGNELPAGQCLRIVLAERTLYLHSCGKRFRFSPCASFIRSFIIVFGFVPIKERESARLALFVCFYESATLGRTLSAAFVRCYQLFVCTHV